MMKFHYIIVLIVFTSLSSCLDNSSGNKRGDAGNVDIGINADSYKAALLTVDPSFLGSAVQIVSVNHDTGVVSSSPEVISKDQSDFKVSAHGEYFYHIGRYQIDSIYKYAFNEPSSQIWQGDLAEGFDLAPGEQALNAKKLVFVDDNKAYLINYGSDKVWIVNPSATEESNFKLGELDLSAYADGDNSAYGEGVSYPEITDAIIVGNRLFVLMQRLRDWCPESEDAFIAVFNIDTDTELDIDSSTDPEGLKGIRLSLRNPESIDYHSDTGLLVAAVGGGTIWACSPADPYSGGIEKIDVSTFEGSVLLDDGDNNTHPYDFISSAVVLDASNAFFTAYRAWGDSALYHFNPLNGQVTGLVSGFGDQETIDIRFIAKAPDGALWLGSAQNLSVDNSKPQLHILDKTGKGLSKLDLLRDPDSVAFSK